MPSLYLHVGPHKTGTTSIQELLSVNARQIGARGTRVYLERHGWGKPQGNAWQLAHAFVREELATPMRLNGSEHQDEAARRARIERFSRWVSRGGGGAVIVSSESFSFLRTEAEACRLRVLFKANFDTVVPIIARRESEEWRRSWTKQLEVMGVAQAVSAAVDTQRVDAQWYFDWGALLAFWEQFGEARIIDYDAALAKDGSILPTFLASADLADIEVEGDFFLNETLKPAQRSKSPLALLNTLARRF